MSRPTTTTTSGRDRRFGTSYGIEQNGSQVTREVNASLNVKASDGRAEGLARALGVVNAAVQPALVQRIQESSRIASEEGLLDFQTGKVDAARVDKNRAYRIGVSKAKARADVSAAELEWNQKVIDEGLNNLEPEEFKAAFQAWQAERFDKYADDAVEREYALPGILALTEKAEASYHKELLNEQAVTYEQNSGVGLTSFLRDSDEALKFVAPDSPEAQAIKAGVAARVEEEHAQHYAVLGGTRANALIAEQMIQSAVAAGRPELIDLIPKRAASVPAIGRAMQHGRNEAIAVRDRDLQRQSLAASKLSQQHESDLMVAVMQNKPVATTVERLLQSRELTPEDARSILGFHKAWNAGTDDDSEADLTASLDLEVKIAKGEAGATDVIEAVRTKRITRAQGAALLNDVKGARNQRSDIYLDDLMKRTTPKGVDTWGNKDVAGMQRQADIAKDFRERVAKGEDPKAVYDDIMDTEKLTSGAAPGAAPGAATVPAAVARDAKGEKPTMAEINAVKDASERLRLIDKHYPRSR